MVLVRLVVLVGEAGAVLSISFQGSTSLAMVADTGSVASATGQSFLCANYSSARVRAPGSRVGSSAAGSASSAPAWAGQGGAG